MKLQTWIGLGLCLALAACGGGGGGSTAPSVSTVAANAPPPTGIYDVDYLHFHGTYALLEDGRFYGFHYVGSNVLAGHPYGRLSAQNGVLAKDPITWVNFIDDLHQYGTFENNPVFGRTVEADGIHVELSSDMGRFQAILSPPKAWGDGSARTLYADAIPLATLAGTYNGLMRSIGIRQTLTRTLAFSIDAAGRVAADVGYCQFKGQIKQHGTSGLYDVNWEATGDTCRYVAPLGGIVMPLSMANGRPSLAFITDTAEPAQSAVFIINHD